MTEVRIEEEPVEVLMGRLRVSFAGTVFLRTNFDVFALSLFVGVVCCEGISPDSWLLEAGLDTSNTSSEEFGLPSPFSSKVWKVEGVISVECERRFFRCSF